MEEKNGICGLPKHEPIVGECEVEDFCWFKGCVY